MEYGRIISESWELLRRNKVLWLLGFLAALGGGGFSVNGQFSTQNIPFPSGELEGGELPPEMLEQFEQLAESFQQGDVAQIMNGIAALIGISAALLVGLLIFAIILGIGLWLISLMARIGLVSAVSTDQQGGPLAWSDLLSDASRHLWRVVGLKLLLYAPLLLLFFGLFGVTFGSVFLTIMNSAGEMATPPPALGMIPLLICGSVCLGIPIMIALQITDGYAFRSLVLEGTSIIDSIKRGWRVGLDNLGSTLIMGLIFMLIGLAFSIVAAIVVLLPLALIGFAAAMSGGGFVLMLAVVGVISILLMAVVNSIYVAVQSIAFSKIYLEVTGEKVQPELSQSMI